MHVLAMNVKLLLNAHLCVPIVVIIKPSYICHHQMYESIMIMIMMMMMIHSYIRGWRWRRALPRRP